MKKPIGLKIIIVLYILMGIAALIVGIKGLQFYSMSPEELKGASEVASRLGQNFNLNLIKFGVPITIISGILFLIIAHGISNLKEWARKLSIYVCIFSIIYALISDLLKPGFSIPQYVWNGIVIYYLGFTGVKKQFK